MLLYNSDYNVMDNYCPTFHICKCKHNEFRKLERGSGRYIYVLRKSLVLQAKVTTDMF